MNWLIVRYSAIVVELDDKTAEGAMVMTKLFSILCILAGLYALMLFFASLAGHPPTTGMGMAIIPITFFAAIALFIGAAKLWKRNKREDHL